MNRTLSKQIAIYKHIYGWDVLCSPMRSDLEFVKHIKKYLIDEEYLERCICNRMRHQQRIKKIAINNAVEKLKVNWEKLKSCHNFESLYDTIYDTIAKQKDNKKTWISNCTVYDTAIRIGYSLDNIILPDKYVYVHQKLIKNAENILGKNHIEDKCRVLREDFVKLDKCFGNLMAIEIEDFLCLIPLLEEINIKKQLSL